MGVQHDPGILRTRLGKLRKVAPHATSKRTLEHDGAQRVQKVQSVQGHEHLHCCPLLTSYTMFKRSKLPILFFKKNGW